MIQYPPPVFLYEELLTMKCDGCGKTPPPDKRVFTGSECIGPFWFGAGIRDEDKNSERLVIIECWECHMKPGISPMTWRVRERFNAGERTNALDPQASAVSAQQGKSA